jgi:hypothetical protein
MNGSLKDQATLVAIQDQKWIAIADEVNEYKETLKVYIDSSTPNHSMLKSFEQTGVVSLTVSEGKYRCS